MKRLSTLLLFSCALALTADQQLRGATPQIGDRVEDFTLRSHRGREWSLSDFADRKAVVVAFLGTECPLARLYGRRLAAIQERFEEQGVAVIGIDSNTQDSMTELTAYAERYDVSFPLLKDVGNRVADAMQAARTPEVFLLDTQRRVRYHGRIDDQYVVGLSRDKADRRDLEIAIEELLADKAISVPQTVAVGCHIGRVKQVEPTGDVTYCNQIARIVNRRCVECHREGEIAPFPLTRYDDFVGWEDTILEVIEDRRMPPWSANPAHGKFRNDARLTDEEKHLIFKWIENGMPEGDRSQLPTPPTFVEGWRIPEPDKVFHMDEQAFTVPADGIVDYKYFVVDPGWDEDKYIYAAEARPGNTSVVHHILVYIKLKEGDDEDKLKHVLVGYAPGSTPVHFADGRALRVPAGSKLLFEMHYTPNGYEQEDRSYAGVCFMDKEDVTKLVHGRLAINTDFRIPPGEESHVVTAEHRFHRDERLLSMTPHMHLRGKAFKYEALYPDGSTEVLLDVPAYDFNWQLKYILDEPKLMPRNTEIHCTAVYDNSAGNPANPGPEKTVRWGNQSFEEMMIGFFSTMAVESESKSVVSRDVKIDPSGVWSWERDEGGETIKESLALHLNGDQLTGVLHSRGRKIEVSDAIVHGDRLTFAIQVPELAWMAIDFDATVEQEELSGEVTFSLESVGKSKSYPWVARRATSEEK